MSSGQWILMARKVPTPTKPRQWFPRRSETTLVRSWPFSSLPIANPYFQIQLVLDTLSSAHQGFSASAKLCSFGEFAVFFNDDLRSAGQCQLQCLYMFSGYLIWTLSCKSHEKCQQGDNQLLLRFGKITGET